MTYGDLTLARIVEQMAAVDDAAYITAMHRLYPNGAWHALDFEGGKACYAGNSPFSNVHGFGTGDVSTVLLERIETFFDTHQHPVTLSVASVSSSDAFRILSERGYAPIAYKNVYVLAKKKVPEREFSGRIAEAKTAPEIATWSRVVANGFAGRELPEPDLITQGQAVKSGNRFFIGYVGENPVAGASLYVNGKFARLGGMTTLAAHQGRGFQTKLIESRIDTALAAGCEIITSDSVPGNNSQRNLERLGFKLAYVRATYRKPNRK